MSVMNKGVRFIISRISSAVCDFTEAIDGGRSGIVGSFWTPSSLIGNGIEFRNASGGMDGAPAGGLFRSIDSSKSSGSSSMRDIMLVLKVFGCFASEMRVVDVEAEKKEGTRGSRDKS